MAVPDFGVDATDVQSKFFPAMPAFGVATRPTTSAVADMVVDAGAEVCAALHAAGLDYVAINADPTSYPISFVKCANQVRLLVAIQIQQAYAGADTVSKAWLEQAAAWYARLDEQGSAAMPDGPTVSEEPRGPRTHINHWSLDTDNANAPSDLATRFRRDDVL